MLGSKPRHFERLLSFGLLIAAAWIASSPASNVARAERPRVELTPAPKRSALELPELVISAESLRALDLPEVLGDALGSWMDYHYDEIPPTDSDDPIGSLPILKEVVGRVMSHGIGFGHELLKDHEAFATYSHGQFLLQLSKHFPRFVLVGMGERTNIRGRNDGGRRYDAAIGVQLAALGSPDLKLKNGDSHLLFRIMPFGLDWERAEAGFYRSRKTKDADAAIITRPAFEAEAASQQGILQPGARVVLQPDIQNPGETRVLAEAYLKIEIPQRFDEFKEIAIMPRCMIDRTVGTHRSSENPAYGDRFNQTYEKLHSTYICSVNLRFKLATK